MKLTTKTRYAVRALVYLAGQRGRKAITLKEVARKQEIKAKYLEQIFIKLHRAGLIHSVKGPGGGYYITRNPKSIKLREIMTVVSESCAPVFCVDDNKVKSCPRIKHCLARPYWQKLKKTIDKFFNTYSIYDLCKGGRP